MGKLGWFILVIVACFLLPEIVKWNHGGQLRGFISAVFVIGAVYLICNNSPKKPAANPVTTKSPTDNVLPPDKGPIGPVS
jgi:hypothetical protein